MNLLEIFLLACAAAIYPTLLAVVIVLLRRPSPTRRLTVFLSGALLAGLGVGLGVIFGLSAGNTGLSHSVNGAVYLAGGVLALAVGALLLRPSRRSATERADRRAPSWTQRVLRHDALPIIFVLGVVLNLPGLWYVLGLKDITTAGYGTGDEVALVIGFNIIMFALVEVPLLGFVLSPSMTHERVSTLNEWTHRNGRRVCGQVALALGGYLLIRGLILLP
jgi:hypothetical protein